MFQYYGKRRYAVFCKIRYGILRSKLRTKSDIRNVFQFVQELSELYQADTSNGSLKLSLRPADINLPSCLFQSDSKPNVLRDDVYVGEGLHLLPTALSLSTNTPQLMWVDGGLVELPQLTAIRKPGADEWVFL